MLMSTAPALSEFGRQLEDAASLGRVVGELLATRTSGPALLALGEPTHGIKAFPLLRNELLGQLVERGYRSIVLETDAFAALLVDDYVNGGEVDIEKVLATGFSHGFGAVPGNRELVEWLRDYNDGRAPADRVRFYGFDAPVEYSGAPSPRGALSAAGDFLPAAMRTHSFDDIDLLLGQDTDWSNPAAMFDPAASIGNSDHARALRIIADDLGSVLRRAAPVLRSADPEGYDLALAHARTAVGLLRYHAAMASSAPDRIGTLLSLRAEMMAENLLAVVAQEQRRGPGLLFAHNAHLLRVQSDMPVNGDVVSWGSAGSLVGLALGERYVVVATDANPDSEPGTLQGALAEVTNRRALFPTPALRAALGTSIAAGEPILPGHLPLKPSELDGADAIIFVADTDGKRHQYW
ncbi:erythromycin esterase family protein [Rhodococcus erythropolis]|uniref:erythromycin esterase family protein n=1 Tax=Rhodococcus erythropolis TaxID=1833 RepID=UPI001BECAC75|nr:erythromycin esterase family protein [Rhodococcus erythropolis]MBT2265783.1 erythromycin esterase family protein [Rhodococcus erythropolis]